MAIALQPKFPIPDRTREPIRSTKDEDGVLDIGWCEGILSDGRAFRGEMWAQEQVSSLTFFFSTIGLENLEQDAMKHFVEKEGLVTFKKSDPNYCEAVLFQDNGGNQVWSVNIVVGDDDETFINGSITFFPYSKVGGPNTFFNPVPIKAAYQNSAHSWKDE